MRRRKPKTIHLKQPEAQEIQRLLRDDRTQQRIVRQGRVLLAMRNAKTAVSKLWNEHIQPNSVEP